MTTYIAAIALVAAQAGGAQISGASECLHMRTEFRFEVNLPYAEAFPLFGAQAERQWAPGWDPKFVYPDPPVDKQGEVFRVEQGAHKTVWVNTRFDAAAGRVQYVVVINGEILTTIDIEVKSRTSDRTDVVVAYEWTALEPEANEHVRALAKNHANSGPEWQEQINAYAARMKPRQ